MSLRLITGPANAGKTDLVLEELYSRVRARQSAVLLVPSAPDVSRVLALISQRAPLGISVQTLDAFMDQLWSRCGDGRAIVTPAQRLALLEESVKSWKPRHILSRPSSPGMMGTLVRLVQRVAESSDFGITELEDGPAAELKRCVSCYEQLLADAAFVERAEAHRKVGGSLDSVVLPPLIALDGFTSLTAAQELFATRAAGRSDVLVTLTHDPDVPATAAAEGLVARLEALGDLTELSAVSWGNPELERIARALGNCVPEQKAGSGGVVISEAWGQTSEAARIVAEVQAAIGEGYSPEDITVALRDVAPYLHDLRAAFAEAAVPATFDARIPFSATPLGRTLLAALQLDVLTHNQLMDLLRSPYSPAVGRTLDDFDAYARRTRRSGSAVAGEWFGRHDSQTAAFLARARKGLRAGAHASARWHALVSDMLARGASGGTDLLSDAAVARTFMDVIGSLEEVAEGIVSASTVVQILREADVVIAEDEAPGCVRVVGAERARGGRCRCLVLGGLNAGAFPRATRVDALSEPGLAAEFERLDVDLKDRAGHDEERLLFYQLVTRPTDRLVLSRQTHGEDGQVKQSSIFLEELLDLYRDPLTGEYYGDKPPVRRLGLDGLAEQEGAPLTARRHLRQQALEQEVRTRRGAEAARRASWSPQRLAEAAGRAMEQKPALSASSIETYLQCPYRWAIEYLVQPRELDDRIDAAAAGTLGHEIMRRFYEAFPARSGSRRVTVKTLGQAREVHGQVASECLSDLGPLTAVETLACQTVVRRTLGLIERDAELLPGFEPVAHEWSFGQQGDEPEMFGEFAVAGRIDRIDSDGEHLVLTDYKSGTITPEHGVTRFEREGIVQLPLYAAVAERRFGMPVVAALYRPFKGGKPRGFVGQVVLSSAFVRTDAVTAEQTEQCIRAALETSAETVRRMREGLIGPEPRNGKCVPYCAAKAFCPSWRPSRG